MITKDTEMYEYINSVTQRRNLYMENVDAKNCFYRTWNLGSAVMAQSLKETFNLKKALFLTCREISFLNIVKRAVGKLLRPAEKGGVPE